MLSPQSEICLEKIDPFMKEEVDGSYLASVVWAVLVVIFSYSQAYLICLQGKKKKD